MDEQHEEQELTPEQDPTPELEPNLTKEEPQKPQVFTNQPIEVTGLPRLEEGNYLPLHKEYLYVHVVATIIFFAVLAAVGVFVYFQSPLEIWQIYVPLIALFALRMVVMVLGFKRKGYQMRDHDISYRTGLIFRKATSVPLVRIQHSEVSRGPLQRLFDLATVKIYTAGGQQSDLSIPGLTPDEAFKVRDYINQIVREHAEG